MADSESTALAAADTPSGIPMSGPDVRTQEFVQETVSAALADVMMNPANPLGQMVRDQAEEAVSTARGAAVGYWQGLTLPTPGRSTTYYYAWAGGMGVAAGVNYYAAWKLPSDQMLLRVVSFLQGTAFVAAAAINLQKAQRAKR